MGIIRTVLGDIAPDDLGLTLVHEHILCDFIGADKVSKERYDRKEVFSVMLPYLGEIHRSGVRGFVDCTPAYLGRDAQLLEDLSRASGIRILTNTGLYKEPFLPKYAFVHSVDQIAGAWAHEIKRGIDGTPIKAGFIKIAVNPGEIIPIQQKIVRAAARCSLSIGATIACHTGEGVAAMHLLRILEDEGVNPNRLVIVHCDAIEDLKYHLEAANRGAWVEYDALSEQNAGRTLKLLDVMISNGYEGNILISQDAGWYNVGENHGGNIRNYAYLVRDFLGLLSEGGFSQDIKEKLLVSNPARAFEMTPS